MRIIRHTLNNRIRDAVLIVLSVLLIGLIPLQDVFAATEEVSIPYRQIWSNRSGENVNNSFEYRLTAVDGAPLPNEASGGYYSFVLTGNTGGNLNLHFPFASPGYYNYQVRAYIPNREAYYSYDDNTYNLMIMVINTDSGLGIGAMTIQDSTQQSATGQCRSSKRRCRWSCRRRSGCSTGRHDGYRRYGSAGDPAGRGYTSRHTA